MTTDDERARAMDSMALLAAVDMGRGQAYADELGRRLERLRQAREDGALDRLIEGAEHA